MPLFCDRPYVGSVTRRVLTLLSLVAAAGWADAGPVSFLAGASAQTDAGFTSSFAQQTSAARSSQYNLGTSIFEKANSAANLATGQLKVRAENVATGSDQGQVAVATSFIADSFRHTTGTNPFNWTSTTEASFNVHIDGSTSLNPGPGDVFNLGYIALIVYKPGTLTDTLAFCDSTVITAFFWSVGAQAPSANPCGGSFVGHLEGTVDEELTASFMPGGDFDWAFGMRVGGAFNANVGGPSSGRWLDDFGSTATLTYAGPAGATVTSGSGVFPGTVAAIPEPGTLALVGLGALGLILRRRSSAAAF